MHDAPENADAETAITHRERVLPPIWLFLVMLLVVPAALLVFLPIDVRWGIGVAVVLYLGIALALFTAAPVLEVRGGTLRAGRASIPASMLGEPQVLEPVDAKAAIGVGFDARAHLVTVPWTKQSVRVPVTDEGDPTTAWIMSTRRPAELAAAIDAARSGA